MSIFSTVKLTTLAIAGLLLVGCSSISEGVITEKNHSEAYDIPVTYCALYDDKGVCKMWATRYDHYPERWSFDISLDDKNGWVTVSEDTWNRYDVGDYYNKEAR